MNKTVREIEPLTLHKCFKTLSETDEHVGHILYRPNRDGKLGTHTGIRNRVINFGTGSEYTRFQHISLLIMPSHHIAGPEALCSSVVRPPVCACVFSGSLAVDFLFTLSALF